MPVARKAARDRTCDAMTTANTEDVIELRVNDIAQLFHTLYPFPFRERDLDREAEEYIVGWTRELATDQTIKIAIHFPETEGSARTQRSIRPIFPRSGGCHSARPQRAFSGRSPFTRDRRVDPDRRH